MNYIQALKIYKYHSYNNKDFINKVLYDTLLLYKYDDDEIVNKITNNDLIENTNSDELINKYQQNNLITTRIGCVESRFIIYHKYKIKQIYNNNINININISDMQMRQNAGLYYKNSDDKKKVWKWWINNTLEIIQKSELTSCYSVLYYDLLLWSLMDLKKKFYNWCLLHKIILKNSENKKILYIGNGVKSIEYAYNHNFELAWNFKIPKFDLSCIKTPQTTLGMEYPDDNMIITTEKIVDEILLKYNNFDTFILGCGAYGPPIINILSKKLPNKNLIYLGSDCYKMFGIYSKGMPIPINDCDVNIKGWIEVLEDCDEKCKNIDNGKYWKT